MYPQTFHKHRKGGAEMNRYPNFPTPPSSNEDSPQPIIGNDPFLSHIQILSVAESAPCLRIVEQPIDRFRFRYKSEMTGTHGSLCGINSNKGRKNSFPTVELCNFNEPAIIRCSLYQIHKGPMAMPHAHRLVRKMGKEEMDEPHDVEVSSQKGFIHSFHSMGIIHTAKKNLQSELYRKLLKLRMEEIAVQTGTTRKLNTKEDYEIKTLSENESKSINLNTVRLRFDAFVRKNSILYPICAPVYTHGINNLKNALTGELKIVRIDHCTSPAKGGREVFMLVERVMKKNIKVRFYEVDDDDNELWEAYGQFSDLDVHHQYAIVFKTPPYRNPYIMNTVRVFVQLERPSDMARSDPKEFRYIPNTDNYKLGVKRPRSESYYSSYESSVPSHELPYPVSEIMNEKVETISDEIKDAIGNINSDEFKKMWEEFGNQDISFDVDNLKKCSRKYVQSCDTALYKPKTQEECDELKKIKEFFKEYGSFKKSSPAFDRCVAMLNAHLDTPNETNAIHMAIKQGRIEYVNFFAKILNQYKLLNLFDVPNEFGDPAIHVAVHCNHINIVKLLLENGVNASVLDRENSTALHVALEKNRSINMLEEILCANYKNTFINEENSAGDTPLFIAVKTKNLKAVKLLCMNGADVNRRHKKSGFSALRFAVEEKKSDIIMYLLKNTDADPLLVDYKDVSSSDAAKLTCPESILGPIISHMESKGYPTAEIKMEVDDPSDGEVDSKISIKNEELSYDEIKEKLTEMKTFTPTCLSALAEILDRTREWGNLADLLDLGHLVKLDVISNCESPSKFLLEFAVGSNGDSIWQIREFLDALGQLEAVKLIDAMALDDN